jgi:hypothetical protein
MLKTLVLLKRRPGMTMEEFVDYYENHHAKLGEKYLLPEVKRYSRRYVQPEKNPITGQVEELDFDVVMEMWWDSRADFDTAMARVSSDGVREQFFEDEERIFNSHANRVFMVEEYDSKIGEWG